MSILLGVGFFKAPALGRSLLRALKLKNPSITSGTGGEEVRAGGIVSRSRANGRGLTIPPLFLEGVVTDCVLVES